MKRPTPIYLLKRQAKTLSRDKNIPLHKALNQIAKNEGYQSWSLLSASRSIINPAQTLLKNLKPGDIGLLAARPGHGKTLMGLKLIIEAIKQGGRGNFFTLEYNEQDIQQRFDNLNADIKKFQNKFSFDTSDAINSDYIIKCLKHKPKNSVIVIDYLQLLDQKRDNPDLTTQISSLKKFAKNSGLTMLFLSQIDRSFELSKKKLPDLKDIRLPNPLDLTLFNKSCFLHNDKFKIEANGR